jgi:hypothetical protein
MGIKTSPLRIPLLERTDKVIQRERSAVQRYLRGVLTHEAISHANLMSRAWFRWLPCSVHYAVPGVVEAKAEEQARQLTHEPLQRRAILDALMRSFRWFVAGKCGCPRCAAAQSPDELPASVNDPSRLGITFQMLHSAFCQHATSSIASGDDGVASVSSMLLAGAIDSALHSTAIRRVFSIADGDRDGLLTFFEFSRLCVSYARRRVEKALTPDLRVTQVPPSESPPVPERSTIGDPAVDEPFEVEPEESQQCFQPETDARDLAVEASAEVERFFYNIFDYGTWCPERPPSSPPREHSKIPPSSRTLLSLRKQMHALRALDGFMTQDCDLLGFCVTK